MRLLDCQPGWWIRIRSYEGHIAWMERGCGVGYGYVTIHFQDGRKVRREAGERVRQWWAP